MLISRLFPLCLICGLLLGSSIVKADPLIRACAKNAAHPDDPGNLGYGVAYKKIITGVAKELCLKAYQKFPNNGLVNTALSRAYNKLGQYDASFKHASIAVQNDYPFGNYVMGTHYSFGDGVPKSEKEANKWYVKGANKGVAVASMTIAANLLNGHGVKRDLTLANQWIDKAITQGHKKAEYTKGLITEAQAEQQKDRSGNIGAYLASLRKAQELITKVDYKTDLNGSKAIARINKKIENQQPKWAAIIPAITNAQRNSKQKGYPWKTIPLIRSKNGKTYQAAYVNVSNTLLALWHEFDKTNDSSQWYIDFDYRGTVAIDTIIKLSVHYSGKFYNFKPDKTYEEIAFTEMSNHPMEKGQRAVGKIDYRSVELLMQGTDIVAHYWSKKAKRKSFTLPLNMPNHHSDAKNIIDSIARKVKSLSPSCCQNSKIKPFTFDYWFQRKSCENVSLIREDRLSQNFFGPSFSSKTEKEVEAKKREFLALCEEVRLPITYKKIETVNVGGKEVDKEIYDQLIRRAILKKQRQEKQ